VKIIEINGQELTLEFWHTAHGIRLYVNEYDGREWRTVSGDLYPLMTEFEILNSFASEFLGDSVHGETLATALGVEMRTSEDVKCEKCSLWRHYEDEEMVLGANMLPEIIERLDIDYWDYYCYGCYMNALGEWDKSENLAGSK
jgi:hypothetical protein